MSITPCFTLPKGQTNQAVQILFAKPHLIFLCQYSPQICHSFHQVKKIQRLHPWSTVLTEHTGAFDYSLLPFRHLTFCLQSWHKNKTARSGYKIHLLTKRQL